MKRIKGPETIAFRGLFVFCITFLIDFRSYQQLMVASACEAWNNPSRVGRSVGTLQALRVVSG